jgi:hypothetical protein
MQGRARPSEDLVDLPGTTLDVIEPHVAALPVPSHSLASTLPHNLISPEFVQFPRRQRRPQFPADDPHPNRRIEQGKGRDGMGWEGKGSGNGRERRRAAQNIGGRTGHE